MSDAWSAAHYREQHVEAEIDQQIHQAREALRGEVVALAVSGAEQVLMREVDASAHDEALGKLAAQL